jgi:hypothetical protein
MNLGRGEISQEWGISKSSRFSSEEKIMAVLHGVSTISAPEKSGWISILQRPEIQRPFWGESPLPTIINGDAVVQSTSLCLKQATKKNR